MSHDQWDAVVYVLAMAGAWQIRTWLLQAVSWAEKKSIARIRRESASKKEEA